MSKGYDLEERTFQFAKDVRIFVQTLKPTIGMVEDSKQLVRSSGSVGANYIEANEGLSQKDFLHRVKISRKEAKESVYWLRLIKEANQINNVVELDKLIQEGQEIRKILSAIIKKVDC
ncbi:MAG: four helix bundle protein [Crocinitomicaceae bacterium]|nr:four helix bundle protein [Crocinitomicaceae bacterium]